MSTLVFATNNPHKLHEIQPLLEDNYTILSLEDIGCKDEIPEDHETLEENALQKARFIYDKYNSNCIADDTGLEVDILNGAPGVYSARYAGHQKRPADNIQKLLHQLQGEANRKARFRTVIALILNGQETIFEGIVNGTITTYERGTKGFGYDPVFQPLGYQLTFAEMPLEEKNKISHRSQAIRKLIEFLRHHIY